MRFRWTRSNELNSEVILEPGSTWQHGINSRLIGSPGEPGQMCGLSLAHGCSSFLDQAARRTTNESARDIPF
jgi:hypothetical protein